MKVTLIVATYNWPEALEQCLFSISKQKILPDELIIADDGSGSATKRVIDDYMLNSPVSVKHIWQKDEGFQLARIRNKAIAAATGTYIIQIDGDLILHPYFIFDHIKNAEAGYFITGSRVIINERETKKIIENKSQPTDSLIYKNSKNFLNNFRIPFLTRFLARTYKARGKYKYYVKGCNMSFWRADLIKVNGYNETFVGWGREDSEIAIRLINSGVRKKFLKLSGIVYHLYHNEKSREFEEKNTSIMHEAAKSKMIWCDNGINKYLF